MRGEEKPFNLFILVECRVLTAKNGKILWRTEQFEAPKTCHTKKDLPPHPPCSPPSTEGPRRDPRRRRGKKVVGGILPGFVEVSVSELEGWKEVLPLIPGEIVLASLDSSVRRARRSVRLVVFEVRQALDPNTSIKQTALMKSAPVSASAESKAKLAKYAGTQNKQFSVSLLFIVRSFDVQENQLGCIYEQFLYFLSLVSSCFKKA
ncbi:unnamed protein product [Spirodela intermedia]|uniref:Uncharacterized protein n=1 Tax=Spirodela intermedia TaxID=51605 RepID=A0A7I8IDU0_SPIIN|nr:unnamed protein product [Spirodela intermedia]CAA6655987.1 unnamed protein product [Spirodela intermedia]